MEKSISIVVPCLNEEKNLKDTINAIFESNNKFNFEIEILIVNDGSKDITGEIAEEISRNHPNIRVLHNKYPRGLGTAFSVGMILAKGEYFGYIPGDHQITMEYITCLFDHIGEADLILSYPENSSVRLKHRQYFSSLFIKIYNMLFGLDITYYNGPAFFRLSHLKEIDLPTRFFSYHAETVIRFIKYGHSFIEVPCKLRERLHGKSTALKWYNFIGTLIGTLLVFIDIYLLRRDRYKKSV